MAHKKSTEYIVTELNFAMMENTICNINRLANMLRATYDMDSIGRMLDELFRRTEGGAEDINGQDFCFTMCVMAKPIDKRKKVLLYRYRLNTYTNEITCIDDCGNEWTMPLLNDSLAVIRDKAIEFIQ